MGTVLGITTTKEAEMSRELIFDKMTDLLLWKRRSLKGKNKLTGKFWKNFIWCIMVYSTVNDSVSFHANNVPTPPECPLPSIIASLCQPHPSLHQPYPLLSSIKLHGFNFYYSLVVFHCVYMYDSLFIQSFSWFTWLLWIVLQWI